MFGDEARITVVPAVNAATGIFKVVGLLPSQNAVTLVLTVATAGLLETSATVNPSGGGGAGPDKTSDRCPVLPGLMLSCCVVNAKLAVT
jgi:hypothetical protein